MAGSNSNGNAAAECRRCGCNGITEFERRLRWGQESIRWRCDNCDHLWWEHPATAETPADGLRAEELADADQYAVTFHLIRCPRTNPATGRRCDSTDTRIASTQRPIRYHKCNTCGQPFKSVEAS